MPRVGEEFAGYRLLAVLGRGGMSVVFHGENPRTGSAVAVKLLAPELATDDVFRARFLQESRLAASLNHPNIVPIYDMGAHEDLLFIVMRYVPGSDLKHLLRRREAPVTAEQVLHILDQVARALDHAHRVGLVHRDVKPANVLVQRGESIDDPDHAYLADFGISKHASSHTGLTPTGQFLGTIDYIAPEQITGRDLDGRADLYSLGCVLYEALTGRLPFEKEQDAAKIWAHVEETATAPSILRPELGHAIDTVISRALAKDPRARYASGKDFVEAARSALRAHDATPETALRASGSTGWHQPVDHSRPGSDPVADTSAQAAPDVAVPGPFGAGPPDARPDSGEPPPPARGSGPPPAGGGEGRRSRWLTPAAMALLLAVAVAGLAFGLSQRDSGGGNNPDSSVGSSPMPGSGSMSPPAGSPAVSTGAGVLMQILGDTNSEGDAKGYIPTSSCQQVTDAQVSCAPRAHGADSVTFERFGRLDALYAAYLDRVQQLSGTRPRMTDRARGNCSRHLSSGEVSWNHAYQHPRNFTIAQVATGTLSSEVAGGRLFCILVQGREHVVWTSNDINTLGDLVGYGGHADTFAWWRVVHHSMGPAMTGMSPRALSPSMSTSP
jgi:serine/threonine protein kinase